MSLFPCYFELYLINFLNYSICSLCDLLTLPGEGESSNLLQYPPPTPVFFLTKLLARLWGPHPPFTNLCRSYWIWFSYLYSFSFYYFDPDLCRFLLFLAYYRDFVNMYVTMMWPLDPPDIFGVDDGLLSLASGGII